uniref:Uncharacterized protein n=1 Tax=Myoviridae sp. ctJ2i1 TaxID=2825079 RepID=A0A8S5V277_9CAUD|nr:MAG TPA: hypothetical protein [Myoviridae sp. ctJ2i1]
MKPTWGIRKLNEYSVDKNTAIIITDSEKDNYYWADIPDGSLLVNDKTGNLSIKLTGESDWVPMGICKDGTEKLVKDAIINVEYYTIVKFELEHNRFYYHDREEITRIGKLINGKAQFKVGSGLYLPGTNQLEVLINDSVHRNTVDGGLEEINMKYFQIDADDIRLGSTVTVRYINYERLSELYPFIYTQEQVPWFFEDKDLWINPADNVDVNGLTITPLSYYVKYLDNNEAEVIIFTTKNSRLIASRKMNEYVNKITDKNINRFKVTRENNNFYINLFSTYPGYKTSFAKILIKGLISDEDKLTLDVDLTYPNSGMAKTSIKTQLGNIVTIKRNNKKIYAAQNIGIGVQHTLAREDHDYDIIVSVKNPTNGLTKEKVLTIKKKMIHLTANIDHVTTSSGTTVTVETIPGSKINIAGINPASGGIIAQDVIVDDTGRYTIIIPLAQDEETYNVIVSNDKADNRVTETIHISLHSPRTPLSVYVVDGHDGLNDDYKGTKALSIQAESGSAIIIKDSSGNVVNTRTPSNLSVEETLYRIPFFYYPETKIFTVEAVKTNKVPEFKTVTVEGYKKVNATTPFNVNAVTLNNRIWDVSFDYIKGSTITAYDANNNIIKTKDNKDNFVATSDETMRYFAGRYYSFKQKNNDYTVRFTCTHPLYNDQEVTRIVVGAHLPDHRIELLNTYVINPYADMYNSDAYQVLELKLYKTTEDLDKVHLTLDTHPEIQNNLTLSYGGTNAKPIQYLGSNLLEKINGSKSSYLEFYGKDDLSNEETLTVLPNINDYLSNAYEGDNGSYYFIFKVDNFYDLMENRNINIKVNNKATNDINVPTTILHWKNIDKFSEYSTESNNYQDIQNKLRSIRVKHSDVNNASNKSNSQRILLNELFTYKQVNDHIKYIHPNLFLQITVGAYKFTKYIRENTEEDRRESEQKSDEFISKVRTKYNLELPKHVTDIRETWSNYIYYGNKIFDDNGNAPVLIFKHNLLLYPQMFSYLNASYSVISTGYFEEYYPVDDTIVLDIEQNNIDDIIIGNKINSLEWKEKIKKIFKEYYPRETHSFYPEIYPISSKNQLLFCKLKNIPSNFNSNKNIWFYNNLIYSDQLDTIEESALCNSYYSSIFFDYGRLRNIGDNAFRYPINFGVTAFNLGTSNTFEFGNRKYNPFLGDASKLTTIKNPRKEDLDIVEQICPLPNYLSDPFKVFLTSTKDIGISDIFFNYSAVEAIEYNCNSVTFIDENYNPIRYDNKHSDTYLGLTINYDLYFTKHDLNKNKIVNNGIGRYDLFGHFRFTKKLKEIDLSYFTNYYLYAHDFDSSGVKKITFPSAYLANIDMLNTYRNTAVAPFTDCSNLKTIDNLDFILCSTNIVPAEFFRGARLLKVDVNLNYIDTFRYASFYGSSDGLSFVYKNRKINIDHLGSQINLDKSFLGLTNPSDDQGIMLSDAVFADSNISQQEIDKIINRFINIPYITFRDNKNIKELNINSNLLISASFFYQKFNKINIKSNSLEILEFKDKIFNVDSMKNNNDNYIVIAPNLQYFYCEKYGYTVDKNHLNIGNPKMSFFAKKDNFKFFPINDDYDFIKPTSYFIEDFLGKSNGYYNSYFTKEESENVINNLELEIPVPNYRYYLFDKSINLSDIKIKKLTITLEDSYYKPSKDINNAVGGSHYLNDKNGDWLSDKRTIEKMRWPALEEIIVKGRARKNYEETVLGVKIKYV